MKAKFTTFRIMKKKNFITWLGSFILIAIIMQGCAVYVPNRTTANTETIPPPPPPPPPPPVWAPAYDDVQHVRYYYLPDLEVYYDVWNHEYVYLEDGQWIFSAYLPPMYNNYDTNNAFVVVLDYHVYEPWRQHQIYTSHYPRYYYRNSYRDNTAVINNNSENSYQSMRGYNENVKTVIYNNNRRGSTPVKNNQPERRDQTFETEKSKSFPRPEVKNEPVRKQEYQKSQIDEKRNDNIDNNRNQNNQENKQVTTENKTQPAVYSGKDIGKPVKVNRNMRQPKENTKVISKDDSKKKDAVQKDDSKDNNQKPSGRR